MYEADAGGRHPATLGLADQTITIGSIGLDQGMASWRLGFLAAPDRQGGTAAGVQARAHPVLDERVAVGRARPRPEPRRRRRVSLDEIRTLDGTKLRYALMDLAKEIPDAIALGRGDPDLDAPRT